MSADAAPTTTTSSSSKAADSKANSPTGDYYFDSYSHYGIHMEMLKDQHRTGTYADSILKNPHLFKGKIVMDVGCGTGILSMFAAKAGAAKVLAIDCSSIAKQAAEIVKLNGFGDTIQVIKGRLEDLDEEMKAYEGKVDIIISEWMGYFLVYESMLNSVLFARDKYGNKDIKLFPSHANMFVSGISDPQYIEDRFNVWNKVEGLDFSYCRRLSYIEPLVDSVEPSQIKTTCEKLIGWDLKTCTVEDLSFDAKVTITATKDDTLHALEVHFNTPFLAGHEHVTLETAPWTIQTHWRQSVLYLINTLKVAKGDKIDCQIKCYPNKGNPRDLDIQVTIDLEGKFQSSHFTQDFRMR